MTAKQDGGDPHAGLGPFHQRLRPVGKLKVTFYPVNPDKCKRPTNPGWGRLAQVERMG
jgi:hypothetical protein